MSHWDKEELERLKILYPITESREKLILSFNNRKWRNIQYQASKLGLRKLRIKQLLPSCNDLFFNEWNEKSAYILGYLEADGYFKNSNRALNVIFCTSIKDENYLKLLHNIVSCTKEIKTRTHKLKNGKVYKTKAFCISSRIWKKDLENKYRINKIPDCITNELLPHYIRGLFDGDGSVYIQKNNVMASIVFSSKKLGLDVCEKIINYIGKSKGTYIRIKSSTNKCWYFRISTKTQINKFYNWMYKDATIFLSRKKEVFLKRKVG